MNKTRKISLQSVVYYNDIANIFIGNNTSEENIYVLKNDGKDELSEFN